MGFSENLACKYVNENQLIVIVCEIFKELADLYLKYDESKTESICLPWEIIRIVYKWKMIS